VRANAHARNTPCAADSATLGHFLGDLATSSTTGVRFGVGKFAREGELVGAGLVGDLWYGDGGMMTSTCRRLPGDLDGVDGGSGAGAGWL
jgi:hypothetical protein